MKSVKEVEIGKNYSVLFCRESDFSGCVCPQNFKFLKTLAARALGKSDEKKSAMFCILEPSLPHFLDNVFFPKDAPTSWLQNAVFRFQKY